LARVTRRRGERGSVKLQLREDEAWVLVKLVDGLGELLRDGQGPDADVENDVSVIAGVAWPDADSVVAPDDPALRRLLPDAYRDDADAAAEFRRYTDATLREDMLADLAVVRESVGAIDTHEQLTLSDTQAESWLRALTSGRLVMASRLGIERSEDDEALENLDPDDPRVALHALYRWSGALLSDLLDAMS
jgi:hypothetical protein